MADYLKMCRPVSPTTTHPVTTHPNPCNGTQNTSLPSSFFLIELVPQPVLFRDVLEELVTDTKLQV
jgi:hypothetical protein